MVNNDLSLGLLSLSFFMGEIGCRLAWPGAAASYASGYCTSGGCGVWNP